MINFLIEETGGWLIAGAIMKGVKEPGGAESRVPGILVVACVPGLKSAEGGTTAGDSPFAVIRYAVHEVGALCWATTRLTACT